MSDADVPRKRVRYNRYLCTDEPMPKRTLIRRRNEEKKPIINDSESVSLSDCNFSTPVDSVEEDPVRDFIDNLSFTPVNSVSNLSPDDGGDMSEESYLPRNDKSGIFLEKPDELLYPEAKVSNVEAFILILSFIVRFNLSKTSIEALLQLLQLLLPPCSVPPSFHIFQSKIISAFDKTCEVHLYCTKCKAYICKLADSEKPDACLHCKEPFDPNLNMKLGQFFLYMPIKDQIKFKLENNNIMSEILKYKADFDSSLSNKYKDILDGKLYSSVPGIKSPNNMSIQFNIDGIPLHKKAQYNLWPIQCIINELPPEKRKENIIVCGLWFRRDKPVMNNNFLKPFVNEMMELSNNGINWANGSTFTNTKVFPILCTCDAPARALVQNFMQFNGKFGCGFCEHKGMCVEKGRGFCRVYNYKENVPLRTLKSTITYAEQAIEQSTTKQTSVKGVKGPSELLRLYPSLNVIDSFVPDYMHSVLLGVTRHIANLLIGTKSNQVYSLSNSNIRTLNCRIKLLKQPSEMVRKLRSTNDIAFWKASEWRVFLLTSPVLLLHMLDNTVYKHWLLLVYGVKLLLGKNISEEEILCAERAFKKFVAGVPNIYGITEQTYNIHLLLHLPNAVRSWGPLWSHSCFAFEDSLGKLKKTFHGTKGISLQIVSSYLNKTVLEMVVAEDKMKNDVVKNFIQDMQRGHALTKKILNLNGCMLFGRGKNIKLPRIKQRLLEETFPNCSQSSIAFSFNRALFLKTVYSTKNYCQAFQHADYLISVASRSNKCAEIENIIVVENEVVFIVRKLATKYLKKTDSDLGNLCKDILQVTDDELSENLMIIRPKDIVHKYTSVQISENDTKYLVPLINNAEQ